MKKNCASSCYLQRL